MNKILIFIIILISIYLLFSNIKENFGDVDYNSNINYLETNRGNEIINNYPPCFNDNRASKKIYDILKRKKLLQTTSNLLNCISMILCQAKYLKQKDCSETMLQDRLLNLSDLGFKNIYNNEYIKFNSIANSFIEMEYRLKMSQSVKIFLTGCTMLINKNLEEIKKFIFEKEYTDLQQLIDLIYIENYPIIAESC